MQRYIKLIIKVLKKEHPDIQTHLEQPGACGSWRNEFYELKTDNDRWTAVADGCAYGLRDKDKSSDTNVGI